MEFKIENGELLAKKIGTLVLDEYRTVLEQNSKIATRKTYNSLKYIFEVKKDSLKVFISANESLFFIENDKRANTKLPVKRDGDKFVLVDELQDWVKAVSFQGNHYLLARAIAKKFRRGIPITAIVFDRITNEIYRLIQEFFIEAQRVQIVGSLRNIYRPIS